MAAIAVFLALSMVSATAPVKSTFVDTVPDRAPLPFEVPDDVVTIQYCDS